MKKTHILIFAAVANLIATLGLPAATLNIITGTEDQNLTDNTCDIFVTASIDGQNSFQFATKESQYLNQAGQPQIPWQVITVLLPPDADDSTLSTRFEQVQYLPAGLQGDIQPTPPIITWADNQEIAIWPENANIVNGYDIDIYENNALWPEPKPVFVTFGKLRKWKLAQVAVPLARYNPVTKELLVLQDAELAVRYQPAIVAYSQAAQQLLADDSYYAETAVQQITSNFDQARSFYQQSGLSPISMMSQSSPDPLEASSSGIGLAIITSQYIVDNSNQLDNFVAHKEDLGFNVQVVTENDFGTETGDQAADNIRTWLKNHYLIDNIEYALLIGNPDPNEGYVPMKMLWPRFNATTNPMYKEAPSDYYYSDLTGNWDADGDGVYGEFRDDLNHPEDSQRGALLVTDGIDRFWEVQVGRIPFYGSIYNLDKILLKTINYESTPNNQTDWRQNVLLMMVPSDSSTPGYHLGEEIKNEILDPDVWPSHRIYDTLASGVSPTPETMPCNMPNVINTWSTSPFGLALWWTHGLETSADGVIDVNGVQDLNDNYPSFVFQCSCLNAHPETHNNLAFELLKNGAINAVAATRVSWYMPGRVNFAGESTNSGMCYEYARQLVNGRQTGGRALAEIKQYLVPEQSELWMNFVVFNIYGDPSVKLAPIPDERMVRANAPDGGNGQSWITAYNDLQDALDEARDNSEDITEIRIAAGTYYPDRNTGNRESTFELVDDIAIYGGFPPNGGSWSDRTDPNDYQTILSGDLLRDDDPNLPETTCDNAYHVVTSLQNTGGTILDKVTITSGRADADGNDRGGGLYIDDGQPVINNCTFVNNFARCGAAIFNKYSELTISTCEFIDNQAFLEGAAVANNFSTVAFENCTFQNNYAQANGGASRNWFSQVSFDSCEFSNNVALFCGGVIYDPTNGTITSTINNCTFTENYAGDTGGVIYSVNSEAQTNIKHSLFAGNYADTGAALYFINGQLDLNHCTIAGNHAHQAAGLYLRYITPKINNTIIYHNLDLSGASYQAQVTAINADTENYFACIQGMPYPGQGIGNMNLDPGFANSGSWHDPNTPLDPSDDIWAPGDYHLTSDAGRWDPQLGQWIADPTTSPCIDAGNPGANLGEESLIISVNDPNFVTGQNVRVNVGCYGGSSEASVCPNGWQLLPDLTNDGTVNIADFTGISNNWTLTGTDLTGDLNHDGTVDSIDLMIFCDYWLKETAWHEP